MYPMQSEGKKMDISPKALAIGTAAIVGITILSTTVGVILAGATLVLGFVGSSD